MPAQRGSWELLGRLIAEQEAKLEGFAEADVVELRSRGKRLGDIAVIESAAEAHVGRALRGHEQMFALTEACGLEEQHSSAAIHVCLAELAENVLFHSDAPYGGFAAAQGWSSRSEVEVAIVDRGVGVRSSLTKNPDYADIRHDVDAIEKALEPMVTATPNRNTGLGLSLTRFLLRRNGGLLMVRSGKGAVYAGSTESREKCDSPFPGTIVTLTARTDASLDINGAWDDLYAAGYTPDDDYSA